MTVLVIECKAARLCVERATDDELAQIARLAEEADNAVEQEKTDAESTAPMDFEMHERILKAARSPRLYAAWQRLRQNAPGGDEVRGGVRLRVRAQLSRLPALRSEALRFLPGVRVVEL
jgi:DNA-binding FadR family transcriptional regulator